MIRAQSHVVCTLTNALGATSTNVIGSGSLSCTGPAFYMSVTANLSNINTGDSNSASSGGYFTSQVTAITSLYKVVIHYYCIQSTGYAELTTEVHIGSTPNDCTFVY